MSYKFLNTLVVLGDAVELESFKGEVDNGDYYELSLCNLVQVSKKLTYEKANAKALEDWYLKSRKPFSFEANKIYEKPGEITYHFLSVGCSTIWLQDMSKQFPNLEFELWYRDEYLDEDGIVIVVKNGETIEERVEN